MQTEVNEAQGRERLYELLTLWEFGDPAGGPVDVDLLIDELGTMAVACGENLDEWLADWRKRFVR